MKDDAKFRAELNRVRGVFDDRQIAIIQRLIAGAWDEGLDAGRDRWMDARELGEPPVNPYDAEGVSA